MTPVFLFVDLQQDFLAEPGLEPHRDAVVAGAAYLLAAARTRGAPIVHIHTSVARDGPDRRMRHWQVADRWSCVAGTPGHATPPELAPLYGEVVLTKTGFGVGAAAIAEAIGGRGDGPAVVAGVHTHACVRQAALDLNELGLQVVIAREATGSLDPWQAAQAELYLRRRGIAFLPTDAILAGDLENKAPRPVPTARLPRADLSARLASLIAAADLVEADAEVLALTLVEEIGKPVHYARGEVARTAALLRTVAAREASRPLEEQEAEALVRRRPLGTVAVITPWNNPLAIAAGQIAPALALGNAVVWKPAPAAPRTAAALHRLLIAGGIEPETLVLYPGGGDAGLALAADPTIGGVCFTGATATGRVVAAVCGERLVPLQAELGGNNPVVVMPDAALDEAARLIVEAAFGCAGQRCTATRRVIVVGEFAAFVARLVAATAALAYGDPRDETTRIGPMLSACHADAVRAAVERARHAGHRVTQPHALAPSAAFHAPTLVECADPTAEIVQTETFGPVLVIQPAADFDAALTLANGVRHGLVAAMFGGTPHERARFRDEAQAGMVKFDRATVEAGLDVPFGGWKASGIGAPQHGAANREFFTRAQSVYGAC